MGGRISQLLNRDGNSDEKQNLPSHPVNNSIDIDGTSVVSDSADRQKIAWYQRAFLDTRLRVGSVLLIGLVLGIIIPFVIFITKLDNNDHRIYGSCLIKENARFECLINSVKPVDEESCAEALCCWENSDNIPFKCYHSLPSAYQYSVDSSKKTTANGTEWTSLQLVPRYHDKMKEFEACLGWETSTHLTIQISAQAKCSSSSQRNEAVVSAEFNESRLDVTWGKNKEFFFISVQRNETNETIFDTRLGPVIITDEYITVSTVLPTPYFYGLKGGQGNAQSTITYGTINNFGNMEFPFYMSYENSTNWHGVLVDTADPMIVQVVQAPAIMFHLESTLAEISFHIFSGPTQHAVLTQLHQHIRKKHVINEEAVPFIPSYWGFGLHLCRKSENASTILEDIQKTTEGIPYDSDCIDEDFRNPIRIDSSRFPRENLTKILDLLELKKTKIVLSQKTTMPINVTNLPFPWLLDVSNTSNVDPFIGQVDNVTTRYIDVFRTQFQNFTPSLLDGMTFEGMSLSDNFPILYNASSVCAEPKTRLQSMFSVSSSGRYNSSVLWTSVCPELVHKTLTNTSNVNATHGGVAHQKLHNLYGEESLKQIRALLNNLTADEEDDENIGNALLSSASVWTSSMYYGAFKGLQVPFTWQGLQESVAHTVRNYALAPIAGTPICGSMIFNLSIPRNDDLCMRWFQFGLLLPFSYNSYDGQSSYGPVHFGKQYLEYLSDTIRMRYAFIPYYRMLLDQYQKDFQPFIAPVSFYFNKNSNKNALGLLDQFMIGEAVLAAPIIQNAVIRSVYFPPGLWYTMDGIQVSKNNAAGRVNTQITGHITQTPLFLRGGFTIPTLLLSNQVKAIEETRQSTYALLIALAVDNADKMIRISNGLLDITNGEKFHALKFETNAYAGNSSMEIKVHVNTSNSACGGEDKFNTIINEIQIFGVSTLKLISSSLEITLTPGLPAPEPDPIEHRLLEDVLIVSKLNMDWCLANEYIVTVAPKKDSETT